MKLSRVTTSVYEEDESERDGGSTPLILKNRNTSQGTRWSFQTAASSSRWRGYMAVFGGFLLHLTLGTMYTFGNMAPYIASYLRLHGDPTIKMEQMMWINAASLVGQGCLMFCGGLLERKIGAMFSSLMGCVIFSIGVFLTYFTIESSLAMVMVTYGVLFGFGISFSYIPPLMCGYKWFPDNKGLVSGFVLAGYGLGAFVFNQVQTAYLNPNNIPAEHDGFFIDADVISRIPKVFALLAGIYIVMQVIGCALLQYPPHEEISPPLIIASTSDTEEAGSYHHDVADLDLIRPARGLTASEAVRYPVFYIIWASYILNSCAVSYLNTMYKAFGQTFISDDKFLALVGAFAAIFNSSSRIMWGALVDKFKYKVCISLLSIMVSILLFTLKYTPEGGKAMFAIWIWALFLMFGGNFTIFPTCCAATFGSDDVGTIYGFLGTALAVGGLLVAVLSQVLSSAIGYTGVFDVLCAMSAATVVLTYFYRPIKD